MLVYVDIYDVRNILEMKLVLVRKSSLGGIVSLKRYIQFFVFTRKVPKSWKEKTNTPIFILALAFV